MKDDLISRQAVIDMLAAMQGRCTSKAALIQNSKIWQQIKDLPSAQPEERALHESCTDCPLYDHERHSCPRFNKVIPEVLREAQSEQRWIPVTERLPEEKKDVLVAFKHNMAVGFWEDILDNGEPVWYANSGDGWMIDTANVDSDGIPLAWMPLPEPYKAERREE